MNINNINEAFNRIIKEEFDNNETIDNSKVSLNAKLDEQEDSEKKERQPRKPKKLFEDGLYDEVYTRLSDAPVYDFQGQKSMWPFPKGQYDSEKELGVDWTDSDIIIKVVTKVEDNKLDSAKEISKEYGLETEYVGPNNSIGKSNEMLKIYVPMDAPSPFDEKRIKEWEEKVKSFKNLNEALPTRKYIKKTTINAIEKELNNEIKFREGSYNLFQAKDEENKYLNEIKNVLKKLGYTAVNSDEESFVSPDELSTLTLWEKNNYVKILFTFVYDDVPVQDDINKEYSVTLINDKMEKVHASGNYKPLPSALDIIKEYLRNPSIHKCIIEKLNNDSQDFDENIQIEENIDLDEAIDEKEAYAERVINFLEDSLGGAEFIKNSYADYTLKDSMPEDLDEIKSLLKDLGYTPRFNERDFISANRAIAITAWLDGNDIRLFFVFRRDKDLTEDTIKKDEKWVNKGKDGAHGTFKTKKAADAQRKAMFANGYKESKPIKESVSHSFNIGDTFENAGKRFIVDDIKDEYTLVHSDELKFMPYIVTWKLSDDGTWGQGRYFKNKESAEKYFSEKDI